MKNILIVSVFAMALMACGGGKNTPVKGIVVGEVQFVQDGFTTPISKEKVKLTLAPKEFSIVFPNKEYDPGAKTFYATRIAAFRDKSLLSQISAGTPIKEISYFMSGTGMASSEAGPYEHMYLGDLRHHYLYYEQGAKARVLKVSDTPDGGYMLKWVVDSFYENDAEVPMAMIGEEVIYVVILNDANLNNQVEEGEFHIVELTFE